MKTRFILLTLVGFLFFSVLPVQAGHFSDWPFTDRGVGQTFETSQSTNPFFNFFQKLGLYLAPRGQDQPSLQKPPSDDERMESLRQRLGAQQKKAPKNAAQNYDDLRNKYGCDQIVPGVDFDFDKNKYKPVYYCIGHDGEAKVINLTPEERRFLDRLFRDYTEQGYPQGWWPNMKSFNREFGECMAEVGKLIAKLKKDISICLANYAPKPGSPPSDQFLSCLANAREKFLLGITNLMNNPVCENFQNSLDNLYIAFDTWIMFWAE